MAEEPMEVMVLITNPSDYPSWSPEAKLSRLKDTLEWHEYARELHGKGKMPWVWGSTKLIDAIRPSSSVDVKVAIYQVSSMSEFDALTDEDPLRENSHYMTVPLTDLFGDLQTDTERFLEGKRQIEEGRTPEAKRVQEEFRALYSNQPDYVGKVTRRLPDNPAVEIDRTAEPGDPLSVMLYGQNPPEYIGQWNDYQRLIHWQKVLWWHDYTALMLEQGHLSHGWGTHNFCSAAVDGARSAGALEILNSTNWEEFDGIYKLDPIREATYFISIALRPIADERRSDERRLAKMQNKVGAFAGVTVG